MPDALKKKVGPFPLWIWVAIAGATIGAVILYERSRTGTTDTGTVDTSVDPSLIDPTTGQPFASEGSAGGGGATTGTTAPTMAQEFSDVFGFIGQAQAAGFWPTGTTGTTAGNEPATSTSLVDLAPGHSYYDPTTGETVNGPEAAAVSQTASSLTTPAKTALARAEKAVTSGKIGKVNRQRLNAAGYTDSQIDFHLKSKTPLGQPKAAKKPAAKTPNQVAASHPGTHAGTQAPNHNIAAPKGEAPKIGPLVKNSLGHLGHYHTYSNGRKVWVPA